jgi:hypothetical protein
MVEHEHEMDDDEEAGYLADRAAQLRELARGREGQAVVAALAAGFSIGIVLSTVIAGASRRKTWPEKIANEGYLRRLLEAVEERLPESISKKLNG